MQRKGKLYMADWRDASGVRHRKGFTTRAAAQRHAEKQRNAAAAKKAQPSPEPSRLTAKHGRKRSRAATTTGK